MVMLLWLMLSLNGAAVYVANDVLKEIDAASVVICRMGDSGCGCEGQGQVGHLLH